MISKRKVVGLFSVILVLLSLVTVALAADVTDNSKQVTATQSDVEWVTYTDPHFGFSVEYPMDWHVETMWYVPDVGLQTIAKRVSLMGPLTGINIDIRNQPRENIVEWVNQYAFRVSQEKQDMKVEINAKVAGFPALAYLEENNQVPNILTTVFNNDAHFFQIDYIVGDSGQAMDVYLHLLESFQPQSGKAIDDERSFQFPHDIQENAIQKSESVIVMSGANTCCGVSSPGNPFPCDNGNCTWWVWYKKGGVPMTGDAYRWGPRVEAGWYPGWSLTYNHSQARVGDIAWWTFWLYHPYYRPFGHVAYVKSISSSSVTVSQMVWGGENCDDEPSNLTRSFSHPDAPLGYIHNH